MKKFDSEVIFSHQEKPHTLSRFARLGLLRKIAPRLYTTDLKDDPAAIIRRNLWKVVAGYVPGAVVADRTALDLAPAPDGAVFLVGPKSQSIALPGLHLRVRAGAGVLPGDYPLRDGVTASSFARAYLENMRPSRARTTVARTLTKTELEARLERFLRNSGEDLFNRLRDQILALSPTLGLETEARALSRIMGTMLGTQTATLSDPAAIARGRGEPFDQNRMVIFETLHDALRATPPLTQYDTQPDNFRTRAFFEAYFSNFIEGTEFAVEEAIDIVFKNHVPAQRPEDGRDVLGTYSLTSNRDGLSSPMETFTAFEDQLRARHAVIMGGRPDKHPGVYKSKVNRAGTTVFVHPEDVRGTLRQAFPLLHNLADPFHRAAFAMFLVSEVHPFDDGNGRLSRVMMNAELVKADAVPIIVPTVFRSNYLAALRRLSHHADPSAYIRMLSFAQAFTQRVPWTSLEVATAVLTKCNAFIPSDEAEKAGLALRIPTPADVAEASAGNLVPA